MSSVAFSYVKRQGNRYAHLLAKQTLGLVDFSTWIEECHYFLEKTLILGSSNSLWPMTRPINLTAHWANEWPGPLLLRPMGSPLAQ